MGTTYIIKNGKYVVHSYNIITTTCHVAQVWEAYKDHSTLTTVNGNRMGRLGCRRLPKWIDRVKVGPERFRLVDRWYKQQARIAQAAIARAFDASGWKFDCTFCEAVMETTKGN